MKTIGGVEMNCWARMGYWSQDIKPVLFSEGFLLVCISLRFCNGHYLWKIVNFSQENDFLYNLGIDFICFNLKHVEA